MKNKLSIKSWSDSDKPREKLILKGRETLSDSELLGILLGSGNRELSAVDLAKIILDSCGKNLDNLGRTDIIDLMKFKGVGEAKAVTIAAALELGRRRQMTTPEKKPTISSSLDAYRLIAPFLIDNKVEEFWVVYLNRSMRVIQKTQISIGGVAATIADPKVILKKAVELLASSIILFHNHPSGNLKPSHQDKVLTEKIKQGATYFDITLSDHIIIAGNEYFSFADEGYL